MNYNILSVRKPGDPDDPQLSIADASDAANGGANVKMHSLDGLTVSRLVGSGTKRVIGARDV